MTTTSPWSHVAATGATAVLQRLIPKASRRRAEREPYAVVVDGIEVATRTAGESAGGGFGSGGGTAGTRDQAASEQEQVVRRLLRMQYRGST